MGGVTSHRHGEAVIVYRSDSREKAVICGLCATADWIDGRAALIFVYRTT